MSKIIQLPKSKPITCVCCGCVYEFESGDNLLVETVWGGDKEIVIKRMLPCPNCLCDNKIVFESEGEG